MVRLDPKVKILISRSSLPAQQAAWKVCVHGGTGSGRPDDFGKSDEGICQSKLMSCRICIKLKEKFGAGDGNRTHVFSLEGCCSTIELHPQRAPFRLPLRSAQGLARRFLWRFAAFAFGSTGHRAISRTRRPRMATCRLLRLDGDIRRPPKPAKPVPCIHPSFAGRVIPRRISPASIGRLPARCACNTSIAPLPQATRNPPRTSPGAP